MTEEFEKAGYNPNRDNVGRFASGPSAGGGGGGGGGASGGAQGGSAQEAGGSSGSGGSGGGKRPGRNTKTPLEAIEDDNFLEAYTTGGDISAVTEGWSNSDFELLDSLSNTDWVTPQSDLRPSWEKAEDEPDFNKIVVAKQIAEGELEMKTWDKAQWAEFTKQLSKGMKEGGDTLKLVPIERYKQSVDGIADLQKSVEEWKASGAASVVTGMIKGKLYSAAYKGKFAD